MFFPAVVGLPASDVFWTDESDLLDFCPIIPAGEGRARLVAYQDRIEVIWGVAISSILLVDVFEHIAATQGWDTAETFGAPPWSSEWD